MRALRRFSYGVFGVACTHLVFGAIVRITGSGMGCGNHWPTCAGYWFPPMKRPDLIIEETHRLLALLLVLSISALALLAFSRRRDPGVGGKGGVLRMACLSMSLVLGTAILGMVTVRMANSAPATVAHWTLAMSAVAAIAATLIRAGGLGGASARAGGASPKTMRATFAGAGLALVAVVMGGLTAKVPGGSVACLDFPLCGANPAVPRGAVHVQGTHRVIAVLLVLHLVGVFFALRKRRESAVMRRASAVALGLGVLQLLVAGAMIGMHLPPVLRSLHEATGVSIWIATFTLAYLARLASRDGGTGAERPIPIVPVTPVGLDPLAAASMRARDASTVPVRASAVAMDGPLPASGVVRNTSVARQTPSAAAMAAPAREIQPWPAYRPPAEAFAPAPVTAAVSVAAEPVVEIEAPSPAVASRPDEALELPAALGRASDGAARAAAAFHALAASAAARVAMAPAIIAPAVLAPAATLGVEIGEGVGGPPTVEGIASAVVVPHPIAAPAVVSPPVASLTAIATLRRPAMTHSVAVIVARGADV